MFEEIEFSKLLLKFFFHLAHQRGVFIEGFAENFSLTLRFVPILGFDRGKQGHSKRRQRHTRIRLRQALSSEKTVLVIDKKAS